MPFKFVGGGLGKGPRGPLAVGIPAIGGQVPRKDQAAAGIPRAKRNHSSKKGYTGSRAGLGRTPNGTVKRKGPGGPRKFGGSVMLPKMQGATVPRQKAPSLFQRIKRRIGRLGRTG